MSMPSRSRNNLIAGTFLIVSLLMFVVISVVLSGVGERLAPSNEYVVRFPMSVGAPGLTGGSAVTLGGQDVGSVTQVEFAPGISGAPDSVDVTVRVRAQIVLHEDARFELVRPLVGAGTLINIAWAGRGPGLLSAGDIVAGTTAPPAFLADAGFGDQQREQLRSIFSSAERATADLASTTRAVSEELPAAVEDVRYAAGRARGLLEQADRFEAQIERMLSSLESASGGASEAVTDARQALQDLQAAVAENRETVHSMTQSLDRTVRRIEQEGLDDLIAALEDARETSALAREATAEAGGILRGQRPNIERTLANFRLASDQVKLTAIEARAAPWRLLNSPTRKEIAEQLLYDAAQAYLLASVELAQVNDTLAATVERSAQRQSGTEDAKISELQDQLAEAVEAYEKSAQNLLERLSNDPESDNGG